MEKLSPNVSRRFGAFQSLAVANSLLLNAFLAVYLLRGKSEMAVNRFEQSSATVADTAISKATSDSNAIDTAPNSGRVSDIPSLQWSAIESTDLKQYIANLRAAGCPEQIIRDIIVSNVNQDYLKRAREIWPQQVTEYWQKYK